MTASRVVLRTTLALLTPVMVMGLMSAPAMASPSVDHSGDVSGPRLVVRTIDKRDVPGYERFSLQLATVMGVEPAAARRIQRTLEKRVAHAVALATRAPQSPCSSGAADCGIFMQTLRQYSCMPTALCTAQTVAALPPGANDAEEWVDAAAFDTTTGRLLHLSDFVLPAQRAALVTAVNADIQRQLSRAGVDDPEIWGTPVTWKDLSAWLPRPGGIEVWFPKFAVAPGSFGVVRVFVPWTALPS